MCACLSVCCVCVQGWTVPVLCVTLSQVNCGVCVTRFSGNAGGRHESGLVCRAAVGPLPVKRRCFPQTPEQY